MRLNNLKTKMAMLAGGCTLAVFSVGTSGGCQQIFWGNLFKGIGGGAISTAVGAGTGFLGNDFQTYAKTPLTDALTSTFNSYIDFTYPVIIDAQVIYRQ